MAMLSSALFQPCPACKLIYLPRTEGVSERKVLDALRNRPCLSCKQRAGRYRGDRSWHSIQVSLRSTSPRAFSPSASVFVCVQSRRAAWRDRCHSRSSQVRARSTDGGLRYLMHGWGRIVAVNVVVKHELAKPKRKHEDRPGPYPPPLPRCFSFLPALVLIHCVGGSL